MQRELQWASGNVEATGLVDFAATGRAARQGQLRRARELSEQARQTALGSNFKSTAAGVAANQALIEAAVGNISEARERAKARMALSRTRTNLPTVAVALALGGDSNLAHTIIDEFKRRYPSDTQLNQVYIPCTSALLQLDRDPAKGIKSYKPPAGMNGGLAMVFYLFTFAGLPTYAPAEGKKRQPSSRRFWINALGAQ